jgi:hypothetical protein
MGCRLAKPEQVVEPGEPHKAEPRRLTERPSSEDGEFRPDQEEPEQEAEDVAHGANDAAFSNTTSSVSIPPPTVTSQLSDIVDRFQQMEEGDVQVKSEAVFERILRAQYRLEELGEAASPEVVGRVSGIDNQFQSFVEEYAGENDTESARSLLKSMDLELDAVSSKLERT